jgi:hypothetical protein
MDEERGGEWPRGGFLRGAGQGMRTRCHREFSSKEPSTDSFCLIKHAAGNANKTYSSADD